MKKQFLVLAGSALLFASCGENKTEAPAQSQAQIDSAINAKVAEHDAEVARKNDSTLKAIEAEKAAAEAAAAAANNKGGGKKPAKATPAPTTAPVATPTPPPPGGLRGHSDNATSAPATSGKPQQGGGLRSHSDQNK